MRISDWSSDVCSSDLLRLLDPDGRVVDGCPRHVPPCVRHQRGLGPEPATPAVMGASMQKFRSFGSWALRHRAISAAGAGGVVAPAVLLAGPQHSTARAAVPIPPLVYEIDSVANGPTASPLNLPPGPPGHPDERR